MNKLDARQLSILKFVVGRSVVSNKILNEHFGLSRETIRKDLVVLQELGLIERTAGSISYCDNAQNTKRLLSFGVLNKQQRRQQILQLLSQQEELRISLLATKLRVSAITIRNDIKELELEGKVLRKHGSVTLFEPSLSDPGINIQEDIPSKIKILVTHAMVYISLGDSIFLGAGSVSEYFASSIPPFSQISMVTNSLSILGILKERTYNYPITTTSTKLSIPNQRFLMDTGEELPGTVQIDKAIIVCSSYHNHVYYLDTHEDSSTIEAVCRRASKIYMILDTKFIGVQGTCIFNHQRFLSKIQGILIDDGINHFRASLTFPKSDPIIICGQDSTYRIVSRQRYRIGFLVNKDRNSFIQAVHNSILEATAACDSISLVVHECEREYSSVVESLNTLIDEKVDLIIDYSLCLESLLYVGERCLSKGIKLISVDYLSPGAIYFGADNAMAGRMAGQQAAEYIQKYWKHPLKHMVILGKYGYEPITRMRISSALEELEASLPMSSVQMHQIEWGHPSIQPIQELVSLLKEVPKNESMLIMAFNLRHLLSSYDFIIQNRTIENTLIIGQNHTKQIEELMKQDDSLILGCVHYNPETYGESIIDIALKMLSKNEVSARNYTKLTWIERPSSEDV